MCFHTLRYMSNIAYYSNTLCDHCEKVNAINDDMYNKCIPAAIIKCAHFDPE